MSFMAELSDRERRAIAALSTVASTDSTGQIAAFRGIDPNANSTVTLAAFPMYSPSSGSWMPTAPIGTWQPPHVGRPFVDVSSAAYHANRYHALHTSFRRDQLQRLGSIGAVDLVGTGSVGATVIAGLAAAPDWGSAEQAFNYYFGTTVKPGLSARSFGVGTTSATRPAKMPSGAAPRARTGSEGRGSTAPLVDWYKKNREQFAGKWVALDDKGHVIDSDFSRAALRRRLLAGGQLRGVVLTQVPAASE